MIVQQEPLLKLIYRDIRLTGSQPPWAQGTLAHHRAYRFAQGVAERYGGRLETRPFLPLIFFQPRPAIFSRTMASALHLRLALHVRHNHQSGAPAPVMALRAGSTAVSPNHPPFSPPVMSLAQGNEMNTAVSPPPAPLTPLLRREQMHLEQIYLRRIYEREAVINREQLVARLTGRSQRLEMTPQMRGQTAVSPPLPANQAATPWQPAPPPIPVLPPAPRALRKPAPAVRESGWQESGEGGKRPLFSSVDGNGRYGAAAITTPPIDINQLTTQVVQTIDRRIIARRERMGRI